MITTRCLHEDLGITVLRFAGMPGMRSVTFTEEELPNLNRQLNKIRKPQ